MKINNVFQENAAEQQPRKSSVVISTNLIREKVVLDKDGNEINLRTKQIIRKNDEQ